MSELKDIHDFPNNLNDFFIFQVDRNIKSLFKDFLRILEDITENNKKLEETLTKSGFEINSNSAESYKKYRKEILDKSNDTLRELKTLIGKTVIKSRNG